MPSVRNFELKDNGSFSTHNLDLKDFERVFNQIARQQKKNRASAKRTLKPSTFTNPTNAALKALGEKAKGQRFTKDDLVKFDKARQRHKEKYDSKTAGITYAFLVKNSRKIDVERANNRVDDGTGITKATLMGIKNNVVLMRVKASSVSKHEEHRVKFRLEQWDELLHEPPDGDYQKAVQLACAGRISFDCDCGRHQYWYRYLATMGNYCLAPPKEFAFPKIKNPELSGVACKHVLKTATMLQSLAWQRILAGNMKQQAKRTGYGDGNKTHFLSKEEQKQAARNRKTVTNTKEAEKALRKYERDQKAFAKALEIAKKQMKNKKLKPRKSAASKKAKDNANALAQMMKVGFSNFNDGYKLQGKTRDDALVDYAKMMGVTVSKLEKILK